MSRPKNFLFAAVLLSVVAIPLAAVLHTAWERHRIAPVLPKPNVGRQELLPAQVSGAPTPSGTPSAAAQRRAQEFNDATNRFNAPDDQQH